MEALHVVLRVALAPVFRYGIASLVRNTPESDDTKRVIRFRKRERDAAPQVVDSMKRVDWHWTKVRSFELRQIGEIFVIAADENRVRVDPSVLGSVMAEDLLCLRLSEVIGREAELIGVVLGEALRGLVHSIRRRERPEIADLQDQIDMLSLLALPPIEDAVGERQVTVGIPQDRDVEVLHCDGCTADRAKVQCVARGLAATSG